METGFLCDFKRVRLRRAMHRYGCLVKKSPYMLIGASLRLTALRVRACNRLSSSSLSHAINTPMRRMRLDRFRGLPRGPPVLGESIIPHLPSRRVATLRTAFYRAHRMPYRSSLANRCLRRSWGPLHPSPFQVPAGERCKHCRECKLFLQALRHCPCLLTT